MALIIDFRVNKFKGIIHIGLKLNYSGFKVIFYFCLNLEISPKNLLKVKRQDKPQNLVRFKPQYKPR